ncbi:MAG TPA: hydrogenase subunit MbhD domain-containing protein [Spirochaetia bacterium]|nr:hydrogenase subunit MbhD domain-containing protein [Spirochaetia bacterium]
MIVQTLTLAGMLICGVLAVASPRLLISALWLAGCSALLALALANLGATEVAVVELSVGAGLVTVIFVFAISIAGDEPVAYASIVPRPLAWVLMGLFFLLLAGLIVPRLLAPVPGVQPPSILQAIWQVRAIDTLLQVALIFCGVLGSLGLLSEGEISVKAPRAEGDAK